MSVADQFWNNIIEDSDVERSGSEDWEQEKKKKEASQAQESESTQEGGGTTPPNITMQYDKNGKIIGYTSTPAAANGGGDLFNGIIEACITGTLSVGPFGGSFEFGLAFDGEDYSFKFTLEHAVGFDVSLGGVINYLSPKHNNLSFDKAEGWSESYNIGAWYIDGTLGGDSSSYGSPNFGDTYNTSGIGGSVGSPIGFTRNKGYTWYFWKF
jgi:hypothetical protein